MAQATRNPRQQSDEDNDVYDDEFARLPDVTGPGPQDIVYDRPGNQPRAEMPTSQGPPADEAEQAEESSLYRGSNGGGGQTEGTLGGGYKKADKKVGKIRKIMGIRRKMFILGTFSFALILPIIILLAFLFPSLKIPQLAAEIQGYRLARMARTFYNQASILNADRAAMEFNPDTTTADLVGKTALGKSFSLYKPAHVVSNMKATGVLGFEYSGAAAGTQKLDALVIRFGDGTSKKIVPPQYKYSLNPSDLVSNYKERLRFAAESRAAFNQALDGSNFLVRSRVSRLIQSANGVHLYWWERAGLAFKGKTQQQADILEAQRSEQRIAQRPSDSLKTKYLSTEADKSQQILDACFKDDACTLDAIKNNGIPSTLKSSMDKIVIKTNSLVGIANPLYGVAFPICIAYDASNNVATQFFNAQNAAATRTFFAVATAADQQKTRDVTSEAIGAMARQAGDISGSIPAKLASGQSVDTSSEVSPQAGRTGEFGVLNAFDKFLGGSGNNLVVTASNTIAEKACPAITDPTTAIGLGVLNGLALLVAPGIGESEAAAEAPVQGIVRTIGLRIAEQIKGRVTFNAVRNTATSYAISDVASGGLTYLGRMLVLSQIGSFMNGLDKNSFANQADMGAVAYRNQMMQKNSFGRPLTTSEAVGAQAKDIGYQNNQIESQSLYTKTFALTNPYSVAGKLATAAANIKTSSIASLFTNLPHLFASIFSPATKLFNHDVLAASSSNTDYGMVPFGWSPAEEDLMSNNPSYDPLVNAQILQDSGQSPAIAKAYAKCFGYTDDGQGNLSDNSSAQIGDLIGGPKPAIARDDSGNVVADKGDCSPNNLGPDNNEFGPQMVFRWRLDHSYQNTLTALTDVQNVGTTNAP